MRNVLLTLCLGEDTDSEHPQGGVSIHLLPDCVYVCSNACTPLHAHGGGRNRLNSSRTKMECVCMCEIQQTAGRLQVQISFPSASLLIKQLNGQKKKVVLRVKPVKERGTDTHANTQHVVELDPELQYLAFRLTDIPII